MNAYFVFYSWQRYNDNKCIMYLINCLNSIDVFGVNPFKFFSYSFVFINRQQSFRGP